jgi:hypothetical protein
MILGPVLEVILPNVPLLYISGLRAWARSNETIMSRGASVRITERGPAIGREGFGLFEERHGQAISVLA